jgi:hypothetical protein
MTRYSTMLGGSIAEIAHSQQMILSREDETFTYSNFVARLSGISKMVASHVKSICENFRREYAVDSNL